MEINRSFLDTLANNIEENKGVLSSAIQSEFWNDGIHSSFEEFIISQCSRNDAMINCCSICISELEKIIPLSSSKVLNQLCRQYMERLDSIE